MTTYPNIENNWQGSKLSVNDKGLLHVLSYLTSWGGEKYYVQQEVNTFDLPPYKNSDGYNEEYYFNHKVKPGYAAE